MAEEPVKISLRPLLTMAFALAACVITKIVGGREAKIGDKPHWIKICGNEKQGGTLTN